MTNSRKPKYGEPVELGARFVRRDCEIHVDDTGVAWIGDADVSIREEFETQKWHVCKASRIVHTVPWLRERSNSWWIALDIAIDHAVTDIADTANDKRRMPSLPPVGQVLSLVHEGVPAIMHPDGRTELGGYGALTIQEDTERAAWLLTNRAGRMIGERTYRPRKLGSVRERAWLSLMDEAADLVKRRHDQFEEVCSVRVPEKERYTTPSGTEATVERDEDGTTSWIVGRWTVLERPKRQQFAVIAPDGSVVRRWLHGDIPRDSALNLAIDSAGTLSRMAASHTTKEQLVAEEITISGTTTYPDALIDTIRRAAEAQKTEQIDGSAIASPPDPRQEAEALRREIAELRRGLETIVCLRGYTGSDVGRMRGYRLASMIAEDTLVAADETQEKDSRE